MKLKPASCLAVSPAIQSQIDTMVKHALRLMVCEMTEMQLLQYRNMVRTEMGFDEEKQTIQ